MTEDNGTYICYVPKEFSDEHMDIIGFANKVIEQYERDGFGLTLRSLYYKLVAANVIANKQSEYSRVGSIINDARLAGLVSWAAIEDNNRNLAGIPTFDVPADAVKSAKANYAIDMWENQEWRPEVWWEKDAVTGVLSGICNQLRVNYFACKGYNSQSEQWRAGQRLARYIQNGQRPIIFHFGDHDPSGIDMTRDNQARLSMFAGVQIQVVRLALNMPQVEKWNPPPNPTKITDSRAPEYVRQFGEECWELDALDPHELRRLAEANILRIRDPKKWAEKEQEEAEGMMTLQTIIEQLDPGATDGN